MIRNLPKYVLGFLIAVLIFSFATGGDFSWITLSGPISLEPKLDESEEVAYIASPALQAIIARFLFLLTWIFFCMIPGLGRGLLRNSGYLLGTAAGVYLLFSWFLASIAFVASWDSEATKIRIAALALFFILLLIEYDPVRRGFSFPLLKEKNFALVSAFAFIFLICLISALFKDFRWLSEQDFPFAALRAGVFLATLAGAFVFRRIFNPARRDKRRE